MIELLCSALPRARVLLYLTEARQPLTAGLAAADGIECALQRGRDLGERMAAAFEDIFSRGARSVVIFGSDSPTLPPQYARRAFEVLAGADVVLGPAEDGGYYLIGCRQFSSELFRDVAWSTPSTFDQTLANARRIGYRAAVLEPWFDLDEWKDLRRIAGDADRGRPIPRHLSAFCAQPDIAQLLL